MDRAKREQMVVVLRYVTASANAKIELHEQPVYLFDALRVVTSAAEETTSGEVRLTETNIAALLKDICQKLGLDSPKYVGQGYDGGWSLESEQCCSQSSGRVSERCAPCNVLPLYDAHV
jgi:hypothetical protein